MEPDKVERIKRVLTAKRSKPSISAKDFLSTGSRLLNLACSGRINGGFAKGMYYWLVGDSDSGKTYISLTCLAEAAINPNFDDYRFILNDVEGGSLMDMESHFGSRVAERLEVVRSETLEDFYYQVDDALSDSRPFIEILDSMDSLSSKAEVDKFQERKSARGNKKKVAGSYGDGKAKANSSGIRQLLPRLRKQRSILIIINQSRDNFDPYAAKFVPKVHAGGHALKFYAALQLWTSVKKQLVKKVGEKTIQQGIVAKVAVKKNRMTGRHRTVDVPIYTSVGIDDVGSCIDYLVETGHWKKGKAGIAAKEFDVRFAREALAVHLQEEELDRELSKIVAAEWQRVEDSVAIHRRSKYS